MNTPSHAVLNLAALARGERRGLALPVLVGAVAPDTPIYVLFLVATFVLGQSQAEIWSRTYFLPGWQHAVDALHSFPLLGAAWLFARRTGRTGWAAGFLSALLHAACDLLTHVEDAHRHLWPLSGWRFASPVSYWDPAHHGHLFAPLEMAAVLVAVALLWRVHPGRRARAALAGVALVYALGLGTALARLAAGPRRAGTLQGAVTGRH